MKRTTILLLALLALSVSAGAETVYLSGGTTLEGEVLEFDDKELVIALEQLPGARVTIPVTRISKFGQFELRRARIDPASAEAHEKLGDWAAAQGLLALAMDEYRATMRILDKKTPDSLREKFSDASSRCGADKLARGMVLVKDDQLVRARRFFRDIVRNHATCPAAGEARKKVAEITKLIDVGRQAEKDSAASKSSLEKLDRGLTAVQDLITRARRLQKLGFEESGSLGRAENDFEAAIETIGQARRRLQKLRRNPDAEKRKSRIVLLDRELDRILVDAHVALGHNYVVKGNLIRANRNMGLALAIDPNDPEALALRRAIAVATASDRWGR